MTQKMEFDFSVTGELWWGFSVVCLLYIDI